MFLRMYRRMQVLTWRFTWADEHSPSPLGARRCCHRGQEPTPDCGRYPNRFPMQYRAGWELQESRKDTGLTDSRNARRAASLRPRRCGKLAGGSPLRGTGGMPSEPCRHITMVSQIAVAFQYW